ncbi:hypothetical protein CFB82_41700 [Burkholderia sp. HI2714]|uniref:hypothetical protein n=1 Tax=Burkholderia sp. HI2714 TaxID=2015359 RepID=UPI000B7ADB2B|nr:hypothetical protein [Burkholderia sp. HI2714]OXJ21068.1 hypothetical protein CFB82_41700 [Burkholderia sp. HI2714]
MIPSFAFKTVALVMLVSIAGVCRADSPELVVGKQLSAQELERHSDAPIVALETHSFKVLATGTRAKAKGVPSSAVTQVVNESGVVGESHNDVVVSQVSVDRVKQAAAGLSPAPTSAQYYSHMNISTLHFASFQAAVSARAQLKKVLPQARVDVPIRYARSVVR